MPESDSRRIEANEKRAGSAPSEELVAGRARAADEVGKAGTAGTCTAGPIEVAEA